MSISDRITEGLTGRKGEAAPKPEMGGEHEEGGAQFQIHDHGDGTFHSITKDGQRTEHPHVGHLAVHVAAHHEPDGKHFHAHQDGMGEHTSHQATAGGEPEGPHDHENIEALKEHMGQFLDEEEHEDGGGYGAKPAAAPHKGIFE